MNYRAVNDLCLVSVEALNSPLLLGEAIAILEGQGFVREEKNLIQVARDHLGKTYRRGARMYEAPTVFDCSSFTKWLYAQIGVWLPRRAIQQREHGSVVGLADILPGDLVFTSGWIDRYIDDPADGVGHVGIATSATTVIHAANKRHGVVESSLDRFVRDTSFRGVRRIAELPASVILKLPPEREVETSDDIKWILLENLPSQS